MPDLTSPAAALARQARMEARVERVLTSQMRRFLASVEAMALSEGLYISPAAVGQAWSDLTSPRALEAAGLPAVVALYVSDSLSASPVPDDAYDSAMAVLTAANEGQWAAQLSRDVLALALSMDTPPVVATVTAAAPRRDSKRGKAMQEAFDTALGGTGRISWKAAMKRDARTAVTGLDGLVTNAILANEGVPSKRWVTRRDHKVRHEHSAADGQTVPASEPFNVGGYPMMYPGDRSAPARLTVNCRCVMVAVGPRLRDAAGRFQALERGPQPPSASKAEFDSRRTAPDAAERDMPRSSLLRDEGAERTEYDRAARTYTGAGYETWNGYLRGKDEWVERMSRSPESMARMNTFREVVRGQATTKEVTLHRSLDSLDFLGGGSHVGKTFTDKGFVSTSYGSSSALSDVTSGGTHSVSMEIITPKGTKGSLVDNEDEREFVLAPDTAFTVLDSVTEGGKTYVRVVVTSQA